MTSPEHVSIEHALNLSPSWAGDVVEARDEVEEEVVIFGVAVTTSEDEGEEEEEEEVGIAIGGDEQEPRANNRNAHGSEEEESGSRNGEGEYHADVVGGGDDGRGVGTSESVASRRSSRVSALGSVFRSGSNSNSRSHSRSSVRGGLGMGESSPATSWTQADVDGVVGERPSGDSERRPSDETHYRSSTEGLGLKGAVDVGRGEEVRAPREGTEVVSLPRLRTNTSRDVRDGQVARTEEVLVVQEEDIGEVWHPLRYNGKARSQDDGESEGEKGEGEGEDAGSVHELESNHIDGNQSLEMDEKERWRSFGSSSGRNLNTRHLRLEFKKPSPQPWDEIDPPADNNGTYASDYYSTLNSKQFGTLQKSRRRPLIPHSSYYFGPPPPDSAYGTRPVGQIGIHYPREIVRIERDYAGGELIQFSPVFPLELEGRITPTQFHQTINDVNEILISAHSTRHSFVDNFLAVVTLQLSTLVVTSHYTKEMRRLKQKIEEQNTQLYNPVGLHVLWPQKVAFLFLEIEYY